MVHSNSSLNAFNRCMRLFKLSCIDKLEPDSPSADLQFGTMGHKVLYQAGKSRDTGDLSNEYSEIPGELEYPELKEKYGIRSWRDYFIDVVGECKKCEEEAIKIYMGNEEFQIEREKKITMMLTEAPIANQIITGIVDLLIYNDKKAIILDYKYSSHRKTQADFDENSQLQLYAYLVSREYNIDVKDIVIGYIDIPKKSFDMPQVLKSGTLSKAKSQNTSAEYYIEAIKALHGENDPYYNAEPGGFYYDIVQELSLNKPAYMSTRMLDYDVYQNIMIDLLNTISVIEYLGMDSDKALYPRQYSTYMCSGCEYKKQCKPWLNVEVNDAQDN